MAADLFYHCSLLELVHHDLCSDYLCVFIISLSSSLFIIITLAIMFRELFDQEDSEGRTTMIGRVFDVLYVFCFLQHFHFRIGLLTHYPG